MDDVVITPPRVPPGHRLARPHRPSYASGDIWRRRPPGTTGAVATPETGAVATPETGAVAAVDPGVLQQKQCKKKWFNQEWCLNQHKWWLNQQKLEFDVV